MALEYNALVTKSRGALINGALILRTIVSQASVMFCGWKRPYPMHNICESALNRDHVYWSIHGDSYHIDQ